MFFLAGWNIFTSKSIISASYKQKLCKIKKMHTNTLHSKLNRLGMLQIIFSYLRYGVIRITNILFSYSICCWSPKCNNDWIFMGKVLIQAWSNLENNSYFFRNYFFLIECFRWLLAICTVSLKSHWKSHECIEHWYISK